MISEAYREQNAQLHMSNKTYGAEGGGWAPVVMSLCVKHVTQDVLDYGCGKANLHCQMPFGIHNYDPAVRKYATLPEPADVVICTDVLEHVEPEYTDDVLDHLQGLTRKVALINIATRPATKDLPDGRNAHLVIEKGEWWFDKLKTRFEILQCNIDDEQLTAVVGPL